MLREIVVEEETPGDFQTTFRLRVDGDVIAKNVTELERRILRLNRGGIERTRLRGRGGSVVR
jgi:hypothetical protein